MKDTPLPFTVSAMITLGRFSTSSRARKRPLERGDVVAVAPRDVPSEGAELGLDVAKVADARHPGVRLNLVVIDDGDDLTEAAIGGRAERFPELAFLQLAVAGEHEDAALDAGQTIGQHDALGLRDAHAQRAGVGLDVRRLDVRVSGQPVQTAELMQLLFGKQAQPDQHVVERGRVVALRREEDVGRLRALVEIAHLVEEQPAHDVERAEARADVAGPRAGDHVERVDASQRRERARPRDVGDVRVEEAVELVNGNELKLERFALVWFVSHPCVRPSVKFCTRRYWFYCRNVLAACTASRRQAAVRPPSSRRRR